MYVDPPKLKADGDALGRTALAPAGYGVQSGYDEALSRLEDPRFAPVVAALERARNSPAGPFAVAAAFAELGALAAHLKSVAASYVATDAGIFPDENRDGRPDDPPGHRPPTAVDRAPR